MKKWIVGTVLTAVCIFYPAKTDAQYTDTAGTHMVAKDSLPGPAVNLETPAKKGFPYKSFLLPASLVVYGVVSLHSDALKDINEKVQEEIYAERNQPQPIHIDNYLQYAPAAAVYGLNAVGVHGKNNFRDRTIIYAISTLLMSGTVQSVKKITGETRPDSSDNFSFPSGHTANAFAGAEFLYQEYRDVSPWYGIAGYAAAAVTGYLRMYNNKHWLGDVVAGAGVGIISTKLAYWMYPAIKRTFFKNKEVSTIVMPAYQNGAFGLAMVHQF